MRKCCEKMISGCNSVATKKNIKNHQYFRITLLFASLLEVFQSTPIQSTPLFIH